MSKEKPISRKLTQHEREKAEREFGVLPSNIVLTTTEPLPEPTEEPVSADWTPPLHVETKEEKAIRLKNIQARKAALPNMIETEKAKIPILEARKAELQPIIQKWREGELERKRLFYAERDKLVAEAKETARKDLEKDQKQPHLDGEPRIGGHTLVFEWSSELCPEEKEFRKIEGELRNINERIHHATLTIKDLEEAERTILNLPKQMGEIPIYLGTQFQAQAERIPIILKLREVWAPSLKGVQPKKILVWKAYNDDGSLASAHVIELNGLPKALRYGMDLGTNISHCRDYQLKFDLSAIPEQIKKLIRKDYRKKQEETCRKALTLIEDQDKEITRLKAELEKEATTIESLKTTIAEQDILLHESILKKIAKHIYDR